MSIKIEKVNCFFCNLSLVTDDFGGVMKVNDKLAFFCNRSPCIKKFETTSKIPPEPVFIVRQIIR